MADLPVTTAKFDSDRLRHLKRKIKAWEKDFAVQNDGRSPARQDISANPKMAARYSEYQKLKKWLDLDSSQTAGAQSLSQPVNKPMDITPRKPSAQPSQTPLETSSNPFFFTPTSRLKPQDHTCSPSASVARQLKWMKKGYVSPTPQKNGRILGLFDKLPGVTPTPPKQPKEAEDSTILAKLTDSSENSKIFHNRGFEDSDGEDAYIPLDPTTPSRKRRYEFQTPLSKKSKGNKPGEADLFSTPAIFRQHSMNFELKESGSPLTPEVKLFLPNRMIGKVKPLSILARELREMQEEEDPGMEVLRELERDGLNSTEITDPDKLRPTTIAPCLELEVQVEEPEAENTSKQVAYKKKGLKRQTKRVRIRPVRATKTKPNVEEPSCDSEPEGHLDQQPETLAQIAEDENSEDGICDGELQRVEISEDELAAIVPKVAPVKPRRKSQASVLEKPATSKNKTTIKADKHANYTRMKMHHRGKGFRGRGRPRR
ncbi:regulatory particle non-ATPase [Orbilia oligospora]|uniref:DNA replication regulator SLD2 n=1 Tax=Orbilia oligospora TaxID=2813651 RepID=A0A7C8P839_ORBOL|nr:regulatory particle non-ATPase [Orbilia oligospora]TGJ74530.1 regulatory particle non-ATPase [Orbilia oligospora]